MEMDGDYPKEITSFQVNQIGSRDLFTLGKKRKFPAETKEQVSKYICRETLVEPDSFSKQSLRAKVFYTHIRKGKAPLEEVDDYTHTQEESTQDSNSTTGESFSISQCSGIKSDGYPKASSYDESSSSSSHSRYAFCSMNSTVVNESFRGDDEVEGDGFHEENLDEFGHCLEYLASACDGNSNKGQTEEEELEEFLYSNGMIPRSCHLSSESSTAEQAESRLNTGKATIDQEFEQYFSMLML